MRHLDHVAVMLTCVAFTLDSLCCCCKQPIFFPVLQLTGEDPDRFADPEDDDEEGVPDVVHTSS